MLELGFAEGEQLQVRLGPQTTAWRGFYTAQTLVSGKSRRASPIWGHPHVDLSPGATKEEQCMSALPSSGQH